jgi:hypothetical protein
MHGVKAHGKYRGPTERHEKRLDQAVGEICEEQNGRVEEKIRNTLPFGLSSHVQSPAARGPI